jgi:2-polyprenyl-3-methyl-5-hydroxy-6-metoxy-1,4-benzoquinol methylase
LGQGAAASNAGRRFTLAQHVAPQKYYKPSRDYWWNLDFLHLTVRRWHLPPNAKILDVGAGQGHWSCLLADAIPEAHVTCLDVDADALRIARDRAEARFAAERFDFVQASADGVPLPSERFDLVTCQTVLMHVKQPAQVLYEMVRVTKRGGRVVCVEPNDLANCAILSRVFLKEEPSALVRHFEFWLAYGRGRIVLGLGDTSVGEQLPALFAQAGLANLSVHISDKALSLLPPYEAGEQQVRLLEEKESAALVKDIWQGIWDDAELRACVTAGGGSAGLFREYAADVVRRLAWLAEEMADPNYAKAGGRLMYIVSGRKAC